MLRTHGAGLVPHKERALADSVVGIGEDLSSIIVSEIGDPMRFKSGKQLVAYAGLDPKVKQSGASLAHNTAITKRGSPYLRRAFFIAASVAQRYDPDLKAYYEKKRAEGETLLSGNSCERAAHRTPRSRGTQTRYAVCEARVGLVQKII